MYLYCSWPPGSDRDDLASLLWSCHVSHLSLQSLLHSGFRTRCFYKFFTLLFTRIIYKFSVTVQVYTKRNSKEDFLEELKYLCYSRRKDAKKLWLFTKLLKHCLFITSINSWWTDKFHRGGFVFPDMHLSVSVVGVALTCSQYDPTAPICCAFMCFYIRTWKEPERCTEHAVWLVAAPEHINNLCN